MSGLPREILKWMQSLDLSYSVKNVKRDFSNGFLVAEILSRYYKSDIQMHSFDNGIGLVKRIQNWALLEKFFRKLQFPIERSLIDAVIHCKAGAAIPLMEQLYTLLTHKTIQASRPIKDMENIPAFARPTASQLIKERMSEADLANPDVLDQQVAPGKAAKVLADHMQRLKLERETDPTRFAPKGATKGRTSSGAAAHGPPVQFKEVQVRQVDDRGEVLQMRANHVYHQPGASAHLTQQHHLSASSANASQTQQQNNFDPQSASVAAPAAAAASSSTASPATPVITTLSLALPVILPSINPDFAARLSQLSAQQGGKELAVIYAEQVLTALPDEQNAQIVHALHAQTLAPLVEACLSNPKQFWLLANWLFNLLSKFKYDSQSFYQAVSFFSGVGLALVHRDGYVSSELFYDFAFSRYVSLLKEQPNKIFQAAKIAYTFVADEGAAHARILATIKDKLKEGGQATTQSSEINQRIWYSILSALAPFENGLLLTDDAALLQDYLSYADEGVNNGESSRARAVALSILAPLGANPNYGEEVLQPILDRLRPLIAELEEFEAEQQQQTPPQQQQQEEEKTSEEEPQAAPTRARVSKRGLVNDEWLIDAELLHVLSCVLNHSWVHSTPTVLQEILSWVGLILHPHAPYPTILAGLSHLTHVLGSQPGVRQVWMDALLSQEDVRRRILSDTDDETNSSSSSSTSSDLIALFAPKLRAVWHPLTIAQTLSDIVRVNRLDNLTDGHIELLDAIVSDAFGNQQHPTPFAESEAAEWNRLFLSLRDHLMVELCDPSLSEYVISILRRFLFDPRTSVTAQSIFLPNEGNDDNQGAAPPPLYCIMRFMYPDAADEAQLNLAGFLEELAAVQTFQSLVHKNLQVFAENEEEKFRDSPLVALLQKLDQPAQ